MTTIVGSAEQEWMGVWEQVFECYELVLQHYILNEESGERFQIEEPIAVTHTFDRRYSGSPIIIQQMFDEMKSYVLARMDGEYK